MPTVIVNRNNFFKAIGKTFTDKEFDELCFQFGIELDGITSEQEMAQSETNKLDSNLSNEVLYKIEVSANRYDLLCLEGLANSLRIYLGLEKPPTFTLSKPEKMRKFYVHESVKSVRHFACSAILRNITFTEDSLKSFIELQDKLHNNICRQRTLATMGTHDLDTIHGDIHFSAENPTDIVFKALKQNKEMNSHELLEHLKKTDPSKLGKYCYMLEKLDKHPVLKDSKGNILALPPIINSEYSKITVNTKNVLIDVTAHDETKANIVLNILVTMFSIYCNEKFTIEPVEVITDNQSTIYPKLEYTEFITDVNYLKKISGTGIDNADVICEILKKMSLDASNIDNSKIKVIVPPTRSDILHACDIAEDLAIGFGYDNIVKLKPNTICNGYQQPINKLTELFRQEIAMVGYVEALTFALVSKKDTLDNMLEKEDSIKDYVQIFKPKTSTFELFRTSLIPSMLKVIEKNQMSPLPIKAFEIADVVVLDKDNETGAKNRRRMCIAYVNHNSGFEKVQGIVDHLLENRLGLVFDKDYSYESSFDKAFFPDRQANIKLKGFNIGIIGVINPEVNKNFGKIPYPITISEVDIEYVFDLIKNKQL